MESRPCGKPDWRRSERYPGVRISASFNETKKDLLEIVVPFFKAGLQANEFCLWVVASSELLKINEAVNSGFSGARLTGSPTWMRNDLRARSFREFEHKFDGQLVREQMIAACTFPLRLSGAEDILDAARTHQFAVTVRKGAWKRVEIADIKSAKREVRTHPKLEQLTFRQREILQLVAKGQNTKQIANLLGISAKTVEAHRL